MADDNLLGLDVGEPVEPAPAPAPAAGQATDADRVPQLQPQATPPLQPLAITPDDFITVNVNCQTPAVVAASGTQEIDLAVRWMDQWGAIKRTVYSAQIAAAGVSQPLKISGLSGWLISVSTQTPGAIRGTCFIVIQLEQSPGAANLNVGTVLYRGYAGSSFWDGGPGHLRSAQDQAVQATSLNAAGNHTAGLVVPPGQIWLLYTVFGNYSVSNVGTPRQVSLEIADGAGHDLCQSPVGALIPLNQNAFISWLPASPLYNIGFRYGAPLPLGLYLFPGCFIQINCDNPAGAFEPVTLGAAVGITCVD